MNGKNTPRRGKGIRRRLRNQPWRNPTKPYYSRKDWQNQGRIVCALVLGEVIMSIRSRERERVDPKNKKATQKQIVLSRTNDRNILAELNKIITTRGAYDYLEGRKGKLYNEFVLAVLQIFPDTLHQLEFTYIGKDRKEHSRPLLEKHPRTGEWISNFATRGYVRPSRQLKIPDFPSTRSTTLAMKDFIDKIDSAMVHEQEWSTNDILVFDNHRYLHSRLAAEKDPDRQLYRIWLNWKK